MFFCRHICSLLSISVCVYVWRLYLILLKWHDPATLSIIGEKRKRNFDDLQPEGLDFAQKKARQNKH